MNDIVTYTKSGQIEHPEKTRDMVAILRGRRVLKMDLKAPRKVLNWRSLMILSDGKGRRTIDIRLNGQNNYAQIGFARSGPAAITLIAIDGIWTESGRVLSQEALNARASCLSPLIAVCSSA